MPDGTNRFISRRSIIKTGTLGTAGLLAGCTGEDGEDEGEGDEDREGGNGNGNGGGGEVHIFTSHNSEAWQDRWENELIPPFEEETPYSVNLEFSGLQGDGDADQRLANLIQAGEPPELYDATGQQWAPPLLQGVGRPINDVVSDIDDALGGIDMGMERTIANGDNYIAPLGVYVTGIITYRQDIYDELSLDIPETHEELIENARIIDEADDIDERGWGGAVGIGKTTSDFEQLLWTSDAAMFDWASNDEEEVVVSFPREEVIYVLETMMELAEYSPDPLDGGWGASLSRWASGEFAQQYHLSAWPAGIAYEAGADEIAANTEVMLGPSREGADPDAYGILSINGYPLFNGTAPEGGEEFLRHKFSDPESAAANLAVDPTRFLPVSEDVLQSDTYRDADVLNAYDGHILDLNEEIFNELSPNMYDPAPRPLHFTVDYTNLQFDIIDDMVSSVYLEEASMEEAYEEARGRLENRLEEAKQLFEQNF